jgi:hypothetical protein
MSQKIQLKSDGCACPVIVCDQCGEPITDAKDGNTVWREPSLNSRFGAGRFYDIQHTHKTCNWFFMKRSFPEPEDLSWRWMSHDLLTDLYWLLNNLRYDAKEAEPVERLMAMLDL